MYSKDFIEIVIKSYNKRDHLKMTVNQLSDFYNISKQSIYNWLNRKYKVSNNKRIYVKNKITCKYDNKYILYLLDYVAKNPQFNIKHLIQQLNILFDIKISKQTIYMILKKNNITRKRIQINKYPHSNERYNSELIKLRKIIKCRKNRIISIDETSIQLNDIGNYGWSDKNIRCIVKKGHRNKGVRFSLLFGISRHKIINYVVKEGTINAIDFNNYMMSIDNINGKYKYLLDNAVIHRAKIIDKNIKKKIIYNIPYSPQYNPIELVNNELKRQIKSQNIYNKNELDKFLELFIKKYNKIGYKRFFDKSYSLLGII